MKRSTLAVLIPAWNEEATIADVVGAVCKDYSYDVIVIDDVSRDRTAERAAAAGATVLNLPMHLGAWGATQTGIRFALKRGYRRVITMDADGQHPPSAIPDLLAPIVCGETNSVIGSCIPSEAVWQENWHGASSGGLRALILLILLQAFASMIFQP